MCIRDRDSTRVEQNRWQFGFEEVITKNKALLSTHNKYYESGKIKFTGDFFPNDFEKGIWKEYNEKGDLIKETNYDAPYKFTWEDILKLIEERKLDMTHDQFQVSRSFGFGTENIGQESERPFWAITHGIEGRYILGVIIIDGIDGSIIKEYEEDYPTGGEYGNEEDE